MAVTFNVVELTFSVRRAVFPGLPFVLETLQAARVIFLCVRLRPCNSDEQCQTHAALLVTRRRAHCFDHVRTVCDAPQHAPAPFGRKFVASDIRSTQLAARAGCISVMDDITAAQLISCTAISLLRA